jgi:uncharacterized cupredoxin-like copper-binding protein
MRALTLPAIAAFAFMSVTASAQNWTGAPQVPVVLSNFKFAPKTIRLKAGQPVVLHLVNDAGGGHDFTARQFFATAKIRPQDAAYVVDGSVELHHGGETRDIALVPAAGRYKLKCTHTFHKLLGMSGTIIVE